MRRVLWEGDTAYGHYQVVDTPYDGRPARVLYSGNGRAAQSGLATDGNPILLFDYNQRFLELAEGLQPGRVLLIGGGVGTLPTALMERLPNVRVDMVEPDAGLTQLAYDFFDLPVDERLRLFHTDGRTFLREAATERYDMMIVDAFHHTTIPADLKTLEAFRTYADHLREGGVFAMNVISGYYGPSARTLEQLYAAALQVFDTVDIFLAGRGYSLWLPQNFILTGQVAAAEPLSNYTHGELVKPPEVTSSIALHDGGVSS